MSLSTITAITPLQLQRTNQRYAAKFPHWTMPLRKTPVFSFRQMAFDTEILATGYVQSRRPGVGASATALAQLLTQRKRSPRRWRGNGAPFYSMRNWRSRSI